MKFDKFRSRLTTHKFRKFSSKIRRTCVKHLLQAFVVVQQKFIRFVFPVRDWSTIPGIVVFCSPLSKFHFVYHVIQSMTSLSFFLNLVWSAVGHYFINKCLWFQAILTSNSLDGAGSAGYSTSFCELEASLLPKYFLKRSLTDLRGTILSAWKSLHYTNASSVHLVRLPQSNRIL